VQTREGGTWLPSATKVDVSASELESALSQLGLLGTAEYSANADWPLWVRYAFVPGNSDTPVIGDSGWVQVTARAIVG